MRFQVKYLWVLLLATLMGAPALKAGEILVSNDEWMFSNNYLSTNNDAQFAQNIAGWLTGGSGKILIDSSNFGLNDTALNAELTGLGYQVTEAPGTTNFSGYNAVFVGGAAVDNTALINYVNGGGSVFVEAGTGVIGLSAADEAATWNPFLNAFGLNLASSYNAIKGNIDVSAFQGQGGYSTALFGGVSSVYLDSGNNVSLTLSGSAPADQVWTDPNGNGLYGAWQGTQGTQGTVTPEPVSMLLFGTFMSLAGGWLGRKKRASLLP